MARMGHDSERAAMIYQHEAQGADKAITDAIDTHVQGQKHNDDQDEDGSAGALARGLMAPKIGNDPETIRAQTQDSVLTCRSSVERVTGIGMTHVMAHY